MNMVLGRKQLFEVLPVGALSLNEVTSPGNPEHRLYITADPTALQQRAFELIGIDQGASVPSKLTG